MMLLGRDWRPVPLTERILKDKESSIGASIFGPVMPNTRREFWNDNRIHWYFHQSINTPSGVSEQTLRYEVSPTRPTGVLRVISEEKMKYFDADGVDLENFLKATEEYHKRVMREIYGIEPKDAKKHQ